MTFLKNHFWLFICIVITLLLRYPSLFEPYWHGDEGISLALGQAIRRGELIYRDITDNKPPLLYIIFSIGGSLAWAKGILLLWSIGTVSSFYFLAISLVKKSWAILSTIFFSIIINIPLFEGNVANGEIFFILPTTFGMLLLWKYKDSLSLRPFFNIGAVFSLGFLFKVPAVSDFIAAIIFLIFVEEGFLRRKLFIRLFVLTAGFITPFVITLLPFVLSGALSDFWVNVFERNLSYSSWENSFRIYYLIFLIIVLPLFYYFRKRFSPAFMLLFLWFFLAVLGSRISIRPYTHYLIQVLPSLSLIVFFIIFDIRRNFLLAFVPLFFYLALVPQFPLNRGSVGYQLGYYRNFIDYKSGKINITVYRSFFDPHVPRTYAVADYLKANTLPGQPTFIWGDDALIYDLSDRPPIGKYIVAYITPIWDSNFKETVHDLVIKQPLYILVSTERIDVFPFPFLTKFLSENYKKDVQFADIIVYKRIIP